MISISEYVLAPVPAGINLPKITFSFKPFNSSVLPLIAASVNTLVVSWNDAADKKESVSKLDLVIPKIIGYAVAGTLPSKIIGLFFSINLQRETVKPATISVSPESVILTLLIIWFFTTSICLS